MTSYGTAITGCSHFTILDGYTNAVSNRTTFPLSNGVISMNSEHPQWTGTSQLHNIYSDDTFNCRTNAVGVLVSTKQNPASFNDFNNATGGNQLVVNFFQTSGEGLACFNIDLSKSGIDGVKDGANVSIEVAFDGGDGALYQVLYVFRINWIFVLTSGESVCRPDFVK